MKKLLIVITILLLIAVIILGVLALPYIMLISPSMMTYELNIHQSIENVVKIELINDFNEDNTVIYTVTDDEIDGFMESLLKVDRHRHFSPQGYYGILVVCIYYDNGDIETIGSSALEYVYSGISDYDGWYYADYDDLYALFNKYVDEDLLPNI